MIEPTEEFGFTFLEKIQTFAGVEYNTTAFEYITKYYKLRKSKTNSEAAQTKLDEAYLAFVQLELESAMALIDDLE
jgi:phosphotransacetylase